MKLPEILHSKGDKVFCATTTTEAKSHPCPDCLGARGWKAISPAGGEYTMPCPRCTITYRSNSSMSLSYTVVAPRVKPLTIGSIRLDTESDHPVQYMCEETGVGSGTIWNQDDLYKTESEAWAAAEIKAKFHTKEVPWIEESWKGSLHYCDYQLQYVTKRQTDIELSHVYDLKRALLGNGVDLSVAEGFAADHMVQHYANTYTEDPELSNLSWFIYKVLSKFLDKPEAEELE